MICSRSRITGLVALLGASGCGDDAAAKEGTTSAATSTGASGVSDTAATEASMTAGGETSGTTAAPGGCPSDTLDAGRVCVRPVWSLDTADPVLGVAAADLDLDGIVDLATADWRQQTVSLLRGLPEGGWASGNTAVLDVFPTLVETVDLDGTEPLDLVVCGAADATFMRMTSALAHERTIVAVPGPWGSTSGWALVDVDGNGWIDIVMCGPEIALTLAGGDGTFSDFTRIPVPCETMTAGQLDGDPAIEVVVANYDADDGVIYELSPAAQMTPQGALTVPRGSSRLRVADVDGDGWSDVVAGLSRGTQRGIGVAFGTGSGLAPTVVLEIPTGASDVAVSDLDGDGNQDLVAVSFNAQDSLSIGFGLGARTFEPTVSVAIPRTPHALRVTDLDTDGAPEIVTVHAVDNEWGAVHVFDLELPPAP